MLGNFKYTNININDIILEKILIFDIIKLINNIDSRWIDVINKEFLEDITYEVLIPKDDNELTAITDDQYISLLSIGVKAYGKGKDLIENKLFFAKNNITDKETIKLLKNRSNIELRADTDYLENLNIPVQENGNLHELFFMNGLQIIETYGFYKSKLLYSYITKPSKVLKR